MPYIDPERREILRNDPTKAETPGDTNFLETDAMLKTWNTSPSYTTLDGLGHNVGFTTEQLAFLEFYIRVGRSYENEAINKNGDLPGYEEAYKHLNQLARERFNKNIKYAPNQEQPK